jgi:hypothetical protein
LQIGRRVLRRFMQENLGLVAAGVGFYSLLGLFPAIAALVYALISAQLTSATEPPAADAGLRPRRRGAAIAMGCDPRHPGAHHCAEHRLRRSGGAWLLRPEPLAIGVTPIPFQIAMVVARVAGYPISLFILAAGITGSIRYFGLARLSRYRRANPAGSITTIPRTIR